MKKTILMLICLAAALATQAFDYKTIAFEQLPATAQQFVRKHFAHARIAATLEGKQWFEVQFANGNKMEFDRKGNWKDLKCKRGFVSQQVIPAAIGKYLKENHPNSKVTRLEKDRNEYEVNLSDTWRIKFDLNFNVIDIDHDDN